MLTNEQLDEALVKRVTPEGDIERILDRKTRERRASMTTGLSKTKRKMIARKAARTKKRDIGGQIRALKKRRKTLRKRKALGLDNHG